MKRRNNQAQSTLEYVIALVAIILAVMAAMTNFAAKDKNIGMGKLVQSAADMITNATSKLP